MKPRTITVTGDADVRVAPDEAVLTLDVLTIDENLPKAKRDNDAIVMAILAAARAHGIDDGAIAADRITIEPKHERVALGARGPFVGPDELAQALEGARLKCVGFEVRKCIALTLRDLGRFESLLESLLAAAPTSLRSPEFRTSELRRHRDAARAMAIRAAKEKAETLASELGQKLGVPRRIIEGWPHAPGPWSSRHESQVVSAEEAERRMEGAWRPGMLCVNASITVTFELLGASDS
jgi:uncharacterized protein YggE